jgi:hypothetical protein
MPKRVPSLVGVYFFGFLAKFELKPLPAFTPTVLCRFRQWLVVSFSEMGTHGGCSSKERLCLLCGVDHQLKKIWYCKHLKKKKTVSLLYAQRLLPYWQIL